MFAINKNDMKPIIGILSGTVNVYAGYAIKRNELHIMSHFHAFDG